MGKPIAEQVVVLTGASSGIGRETAREFGKRGAAVVLAARDEAALQEAAAEVEAAGGRALVVPTDVSRFSDVAHLANAAVARFGRIDTWVNDAAIAAYGEVDAMEPGEIDRILEVDLHGTIYGMKAALPYLKRNGGGTIINVSSGLGARSVPLLSAYCAAKAGILAFADSLRLEMARAKTGIVVTSILPSSINTPFFDNARSDMGRQPMPMPPVYGPETVAQAIVFAAEHPRREIYVGSAGKMLAVLNAISPSLVDRLMLLGNSAWRFQQDDRPDDGRDNFRRPLPDQDRIHGDYSARPISLYTRLLEEHPGRKRLLLAGAALGAVALIRRAAH